MPELPPFNAVINSSLSSSDREGEKGRIVQDISDSSLTSSLSHHEGEESERKKQDDNTRVDKVYSVGCFDLFHVGHVSLLRNMRKLGKEVGCVCACIHVHMCVHTCAYGHTRACVCMCVRMSECVHVYVYDMRSCWKALFTVFMYIICCPSVCSVDRAHNSRQRRMSVLPFALASGIVYTFLDLTSSVSLSEFELMMISFSLEIKQV